MILTHDRAPMDAALGDDNVTILLMSGTESSHAGIVHQYFEDEDTEDWYRYFLLTDLAALHVTAEEAATWFGGNNMQRYAVLGGNRPKQVAAGQGIDYLFLPDTEQCDPLIIMEELAKGDIL